MNDQRNRSQNKNPDFDLDSYLDEKASETQNQKSTPKKESHDGNFFRNLMVITALVLVSVLYAHDWNPMNVYHRFFPAESEVTVAPSSGNQAARIAAREARAAEVLAQRLAEQQERVALREAERDARIAEIERRAEELANSDELAGLADESVSMAIESAMEALNQVDWEEFGRQFEGMGEQIEAEVLRGLAEADPSSYKILNNNSSNYTSSEYAERIKELGIDQFTDSELSDLHEAKVPISFLEILDNSDKLSKLSAEEIISLFN